MLPATRAAAKVIAGQQDLRISCPYIVIQGEIGYGAAIWVPAPSAKRCSPRPVLLVVFRKRAGMIWSCSIFVQGLRLCDQSTFERFHNGQLHSNVRTSVITPEIAAAAAVSGLAKKVRPPLPCRPSKLRLLVLTAY